MEKIEKTIDSLEQQVRDTYPSWNNEMIRSKAVRMYYLNEELGA
jgi:hypothetical protein